MKKVLLVFPKFMFQLVENLILIFYKFKCYFCVIFSILLCSCAIVTRAPISEQIKQDFDWDNLSFEEKYKVYQMFSDKYHYGIGSIKIDESSTESQVDLLELPSINVPNLIE